MGELLCRSGKQIGLKLALQLQLKSVLYSRYMSVCSLIKAGETMVDDGTRAHPRAEESGDEMTCSRVLPNMGNVLSHVAFSFGLVLHASWQWMHASWHRDLRSGAGQ